MVGAIVWLLPFFALAQGTAGTAPASVAQFHGVDAGVLPGNILHSVERLIERASVVLTRDPERRAEREVRIADERAAELDRVLERAAFEGGDERPVATALREFDEQERRASARIEGAGERAEALDHAQAFRSVEQQVIVDTVISFGGEAVSAAASQVNARLEEEQTQRFSRIENPVVRVALREQVVEHQLDYAVQRGANVAVRDRQGSAEQMRETQDRAADFIQRVESAAAAQEEAAASEARELQYRVEQAGFDDTREAYAALEILSASDRALVNDFLEAPTRGEADQMAAAVRALRRLNEQAIRDRVADGGLDRYLEAVAAGVIVNKFGSSARTDIDDVSPEDLESDRASLDCEPTLAGGVVIPCDDVGEQDCVSSPTHVCLDDEGQPPTLTCEDRMTPEEYRGMNCCTNQSEPLERRVANGCLAGEQDCVSSPTHVCPGDDQAQDDDGQDNDDRGRAGGVQDNRR